MAQDLTIGSVDVRLRNPWGAFALAVVTLGVYAVVWWWKINREIRDFSAHAGKPLGNDPTLSALALFPGILLIVPAIWTLVTTTRRVDWVAGQVGLGSHLRVHSPVTVILALVIGAQPVYLQYPLNAAWRRAADATGVGA